MIIFKIQGGLGNQLFQYCTARSLGLKYNCDVKYDLTFFEDVKFKKVFRLDKFDLELKIATETEISKSRNKDNPPLFYRILRRMGIKLSPYFKPSHISENELRDILGKKKRIKGAVYIEGWFGSQFFFKDHKSEFIISLNTDSKMDSINKKVIEDIQNCESVAVHVRRGDYLENSLFNNLTLNYYSEAIKNISKKVNNPTFYFFSDDMAWVKNNFENIKNGIFVDRNSVQSTYWSTIGDIEDLMLIKACKHQIIANSTYSWWGAWLNNSPKKIIIAPKIWYKDKAAQKAYEEGDMIPKDWTKI